MPCWSRSAGTTFRPWMFTTDGLAAETACTTAVRREDDPHTRPTTTPHAIGPASAARRLNTNIWRRRAKTVGRGIGGLVSVGGWSSPVGLHGTTAPHEHRRHFKRAGTVSKSTHRLVGVYHLEFRPQTPPSLPDARQAGGRGQTGQDASNPVWSRPALLGGGRPRQSGPNRH